MRVGLVIFDAFYVIIILIVTQLTYAQLALRVTLTLLGNIFTNIHRSKALMIDHLGLICLKLVHQVLLLQLFLMLLYKGILTMII